MIGEPRPVTLWAVRLGSTVDPEPTEVLWSVSIGADMDSSRAPERPFQRAVTMAALGVFAAVSLRLRRTGSVVVHDRSGRGTRKHSSVRRLGVSRRI